MNPQGAYLVIDAAAPHPVVGVWENGEWRSYVRADAPPAESLFGLIESALRGASAELSALSGYIYAEGPGSVLGLRGAAMAIRAWNNAPGLTPRPVFAVNSLALAAALLAASRPDIRSFTVFAASRRDRWNAFSAGDTRWSECDATELAARPGPFFRLPSRDFVGIPVAYADFDPAEALAKHPETLTHPGLLHPTDKPDAANLANTFVTWAGDRHRA